MTAGGSVGGFNSEGWEKSKKSLRSLEAASRRLSAGRPKRVSMNFRIDVWLFTA